jgi:hypothetical protein
MALTPLDQVGQQLELSTSNTRFVEDYGRDAAAFLKGMPGLYRLFRRLPYDFDAPLEARRLAASVLLYIAENQDFLEDSGRFGLIDDVWLSYSALQACSDAMDQEVLERHWRSDESFDDVLGLAANVSSLKDHVPVKVLERIARYLGLDG